MFDAIGEALSGLRDVFTLKRPLAADSPADEDDVLQTKRTLKSRGYYKEPDYGLTPYPDRPLFEGIRAFQKDNNLRVDGVMKPGGETEKALGRPRLVQAGPLEARKQDEEIVRQYIREKNKPLNPAPPVPPRKPPLLSNDKNNEASDFIRGYEDTIAHMYKDINGNTTIGVGHMINNLEEAKKMPFYLFEKGKPDRRATSSEIGLAYQTVNQLSHGENYKADRYSSQNNSNIPDIRLTTEDRESLYQLDLRKHANELKQMVPDFDDLPAEAQISMLDMIFNMGSARFNPKKWDNFFSAIKKRDWENAARESHRITKHEERNVEVAKLLRRLKEKNQ